MNLKAWELRENETLLGSADASYIKMSMGIVPYYKSARIVYRSFFSCYSF